MWHNQAVRAVFQGILSEEPLKLPTVIMSGKGRRRSNATLQLPALHWPWSFDKPITLSVRETGLKTPDLLLQHLPRNSFDDDPWFASSDQLPPYVASTPHGFSKHVLLPSFYQGKHLIFIMVNIAFGWSAGDIISSIHIIIKVCEAFKEAGGAASRYEESTTFLEGFKVTLSKLHFTAIPTWNTQRKSPSSSKW